MPSSFEPGAYIPKGFIEISDEACLSLIAVNGLAGESVPYNAPVMDSGVFILSRSAGTVRFAGLSLVSGILLLAMAACGSGSGGDAEFQRISDTGVIRTPEDVKAIGFRESKSYDLEGLPAATEAIFGFWRPNGKDPLDFEIRFYSSHQDAVDSGTGPAEEGSGDDAVLDESSASYKAGVKDRRTIIGSGGGGGARSGIGPKYADFVIVDNLVILCPGGQEEQALERCAELIDAMEDS